MFIKAILRSLSCVSPVLLVSSADILSLMLLIIFRHMGLQNCNRGC